MNSLYWNLAWLRAHRSFVLAFTLMAGMVGAAHSTNYSLWIHGRGTGAVVNNYASFTRWGPATTAAGVNKKAVNWDGYSHISSTNAGIRNALDCFCTGSNWCYVAAHSAGNLQIGYALSLYGSSARSKKNATANSAGVCGNTDGTTQTGWNIKWVDIAGGAAGGSELANVGSWAVSDPLTGDLKTATARAMYDHNQTRAKMFYMFAGSKGKVYSGVLPGQDDDAVAYHSSGGIAGSAGGAYCNPGDWLCNDLTLGTAAAEGGHAKWSHHSVKFRDDAEAYNHTGTGSWGSGGGIVSKMVADMVSNAR